MSTEKTAREAIDLAVEEHYSPQEFADTYHVSVDTAIRWLRDEPGVIAVVALAARKPCASPKVCYCAGMRNSGRRSESPLSHQQLAPHSQTANFRLCPNLCPPADFPVVPPAAICPHDTKALRTARLHALL